MLWKPELVQGLKREQPMDTSIKRVINNVIKKLLSQEVYEYLELEMSRQKVLEKSWMELVMKECS